MNRSWPPLTAFKPSIVQYLVSGELADGLSVLHTRSDRRGALLRFAGGSPPVLVKLWRELNRKHHLKSWLGVSNARHEWRMHRRAYKTGIPAVEPIEFGHLRLDNGQRFEAMMVQDLGETTQGLPYLKRCLLQEQWQQAQRLEEALIQMTQGLLMHGMTDADHQLNNVVVDSWDNIFRIDFECARRWRFGRVPDSAIGAMLGRLIVSHVFACQQIDLSRSEQFAARLTEQLVVNDEVLAETKLALRKWLDRQRQRQGLDIQLALPW